MVLNSEGVKKHIYKMVTKKELLKEIGFLLDKSKEMMRKTSKIKRIHYSDTKEVTTEELNIVIGILKGEYYLY